MSGLAWLGMRVATQRRAMMVAIGLSAAIFALLHLPSLFLIGGEVSLPILSRVLILNGLLGLFFGWVFWKYSLEGAVGAHMGFHFGVWLAAMW